MTTEIVASYVGSHQVPASDLPALIRIVHGAFTGVPEGVGASRRVDPIANPQVGDAGMIVSFENGRGYKALRRHLKTLGLTPHDEWTSKQRSSLGCHLENSRRPGLTGAPHVGEYRWPSLGRIMAFESVHTIGVRAVPLTKFIKRTSSGVTPYPGRIILARHEDFAAHKRGDSDAIRRLGDFAVDRFGDQSDARKPSTAILIMRCLLAPGRSLARALRGVYLANWHVVPAKLMLGPSITLAARPARGPFRKVIRRDWASTLVVRVSRAVIAHLALGALGDSDDGSAIVVARHMPT